MKLNQKQIDSINYTLSNYSEFTGIRRIKKPVNMDYCLSVLTEIGKQKCKQFVIDDSNRFVFTNLIYWLHGDDRCRAINPDTTRVEPANLSKGLYIFGNTGTGKSVALDVIKAYSIVMQIKLVIGGVEKNMFWRNLRATDVCTEFATNGSYSECMNAKIIGIQDLGSDESETLYMGNRINVMQQILETRGDANDNLTFITSNLSMNYHKISNKYNDRVASRLQEMCNFYILGGKDRRLKK